MRIIRVFPRRTSATPDDSLVRFWLPSFFDQADEVHISVTFEWDRPKAEILAKQWEAVAPVKIGGPAYRDFGGEFEPGRYIKHGYVITSRGCPNRCWFCRAWRSEGNVVRELDVKEGHNVLDNNLLATSREHQEKVFGMLKRQKERPRFTGGFEAARFNMWHADWMAVLNPKVMYFAYDTPNDYEPLHEAAKVLRCRGLFTPERTVRCYVLVGWKGDTFEAAEARLTQTIHEGYMPMAMLFDKERHRKEMDGWIHFQKTWASPIIVGARMKEAEKK